MRANGYLLLACGCGLWLVACGDSAPSPLPAAPAAREIPAGTTLTVTSGETGAAVANAAVTVNGRTATTDAGGRVSLPQAAPEQSLVDIDHADFLLRQTRVAGGSGTQLTLWPRRSPTGLTPDATREIVYGATTTVRPMLGLPRDVGEVFVVPEGRIRNDAAAMRTVEDAAALFGEITQGRVRFVVTDEPPPGSIFFDLVHFRPRRSRDRRRRRGRQARRHELDDPRRDGRLRGARDGQDLDDGARARAHVRAAAQQRRLRPHEHGPKHPGGRGAILRARGPDHAPDAFAAAREPDAGQRSQRRGVLVARRLGMDRDHPVSLTGCHEDPLHGYFVQRDVRTADVVFS